MATKYSTEVCLELDRAFGDANLLRPMRVARYEPGTELVYDVTGVAPAREARVRLRVDRFVGGGFAGQVYRVELLEIDSGEPPVGLEIGGLYAVKILVPPSRSAEKFRNAVYAVGFQGAFQLQCNPVAARAGALWQKMIRRAAGERFGTERAVVDVLATFVDSIIGSCGEISEWVEGRTWRFEVDDRLDARRTDCDLRSQAVSSPEYRAKKAFMKDFVALLHEMGAHEFARQYEWSTCKSQPNVLKRLDCEDDPRAGLTAVDFRAGLALLPFLPMSPGDFRLIVRGVGRGSLVQFDRGDLGKLRRFVEAHPEAFADMDDAIGELESCEKIYRDSVPDVTHNHFRLLTSGRLWGTLLNSTVKGWRVRNFVDDACAEKLKRSRAMTLLFALVGVLPCLGAIGGALVLWLLAARGCSWLVAGAAGVGVFVAGLLVGRALRRLWGRSDLRRHYACMLTSLGYFLRAVRGRIAEKLICWHREGRIGAEATRSLSKKPALFVLHLPLSVLPVGLHRLLADPAYFRERLRFIFVRPVKLYFNASFREQWLRDMLAEGRANGMLSEEDAGTIEGRIQEPFIQKYLKSLAVHVCTLPVTQVVSVAVALWYIRSHPELPWKEAWATAVGIIALFQVVPISPGSLVRGLYVLYLVIRERNFRDYNIAVFLGFFKYIGYLAFPIQMAYRYPALARFMAGHWSTGAVHFVPVFGEQGALLEHTVFDAFYNYPLTVRRRMRLRAEERTQERWRYWPALACLVGAAVAWALIDWVYVARTGLAPTLKALWYIAPLPALLMGAGAARLARGGSVARRVHVAVACGIALGVIAATVGVWIVQSNVEDVSTALAGGESLTRYAATSAAWRAFWFSVLSVLGCLLAEVTARAPRE
jgi:hypothetical protein